MASDQVRELMRKRQREKEDKAKALAAALKGSKNKDQLLAMMRQKVGLTVAPAKPASKPAPAPSVPAPAASMGPPPQKKVVGPLPIPTDRSMGPPPPKPAPTAPTAPPPIPPPPQQQQQAPAKLELGPYDDDDDDEEDGAMDAPQGPQGAPPASLPPGFFDDAAALPAPEAPAPATEEPVAPAAPALPIGFFDDPEADAKAHNIDLDAKKQEDLKKEWEEFKAFASKVATEEKDEEAAEEQQLEESEERNELEQMYYGARLAEVMAKSERAKGKRNAEHEEKNHRQNYNGSGVDMDVAAAVPSAEEAPTRGSDALGDSAASEISLMLRRKRRKKTEAEVASEGDEFVPLDPLDWRSAGLR